MINNLINFYERLATKIDKYMVPFEILALILFIIGLFYVDDEDFDLKKMGFLFLAYAIFIAVLGVFTHCFALKEQKLENGKYIATSYYGNRLSKFMHVLAVIHFTVMLLFLIIMFVFIIFMQQNG